MPLSPDGIAYSKSYVVENINDDEVHTFILDKRDWRGRMLMVSCGASTKPWRTQALQLDVKTAMMGIRCPEEVVICPVSVVDSPGAIEADIVVDGTHGGELKLKVSGAKGKHVEVVVWVEGTDQMSKPDIVMR